MSPMSHVNVTAMKMSTYCEITGNLPQWVSPVSSAPRKRNASMTVIETIAKSTESTCGIESLMRTAASTK